MASTDVSHFPRLLRQHRMAVGLTQEELAEHAGLSVRAVGDLERGVRHSPQQHTVRQLADALGLSGAERSAFFSAVRPQGEDRQIVDTGSFLGGTASPGGASPAPSELEVDGARVNRRGGPRTGRPLRAGRSLQRTSMLGLLVLLAGFLGLTLLHETAPQKSMDAAIPASAADAFVPWGVSDGSAAHFALPYGVAVDPGGNVYVVDTAHNRVDELSPEGKPVDHWEGAGTGLLSGPSGVAIDAAGTVYVADTGNSRIEKLVSGGSMVTVWQRDSGPHGAAGFKYPLINPLGVAVDGHGNLYVANTGGSDLTAISRRGQDLGGISGAVAGLSAPSGIALDRRGDIFVTDTDGNRVQVFSPTFTPITQWGSAGSGAGEFQNPTGIAIDRQGDIYVADTGNDRIQKFSPSGAVLRVIGGLGSGSGQFREPTGVAVDRAGNVYVADSGNTRIQRLSATGKPLTSWTGSQTIPAARFDAPSALTVDSRDQVYVVTGASTDRIEKLSSAGRRLSIRPVGSTGSTAAVTAAAADREGNVYLADEVSNHILKFSPLGKLLATWGGEGVGPGQYLAPSGVAVDRDGNVYVADSGNRRLQKLSPTGEPLMQIGSYGFGPGRFQWPRGIALDAEGNIFVADSQSDRIQEFSPVGALLNSWGTKGSGPGQFNGPVAVTVDRNEALYVVDEGNNRVQKLTAGGTPLASWGGRGRLPGQFDDPVSVALDGRGGVYVTDRGNNRIERLQSGH